MEESSLSHNFSPKEMMERGASKVPSKVPTLEGTFTKVQSRTTLKVHAQAMKTPKPRKSQMLKPCSKPESLQL